MNNVSLATRIAIIEAAVHKLEKSAVSQLKTVRELEATIAQSRLVDLSQSSPGELAQIEGALALAEATVERAKFEYGRAITSLAAARYALVELKSAA